MTSMRTGAARALRAAGAATVLALLAAAAPAQDGVALYAAGQHAAAAEAFRAALRQRPFEAALHYDLALALWRSGDLAGAEDAAEQYASAPAGGRTDLYRGLLGLIRYREAEALRQRAAEPPAPAPPPPTRGNAPPPSGAPAPDAPPDPVALLEQALAKAQRARDDFQTAALAPQAAPALARDFERALRLCDDVQRELDEAKKKREEQQKQQQQQQKDDQDKDAEKKPEEKKPDEPKPDEPKPDEPKESEQPPNEPQQQPEQAAAPRPEPKPPEQAPDQEPQAGQGQEAPEPQPAPEAKDGGTDEQGARTDAPGEQAEGKELSPEETKRLLQLLQQLDERMKNVRARLGPGRVPVERDW